MHVDDAEVELEKDGLKLKIDKEIFSSEFDEGEIVSQNVKAGEKVKKKALPLELLLAKVVSL